MNQTPPSQPYRATLRDGATVLIRPIQAGDVELERDFIERLSPTSRRYRFLGTIKTPSESLLKELTHPEQTHGVAYVALSEGLGARLLTRDIHLADAPGHRADVELI